MTHDVVFHLTSKSEAVITRATKAVPFGEWR